MAKRLDVAALVSLVGKDNIKKELNKNIWYYVIIDNTQRPIFSDDYQGSAFEYFFFNETDFLKYFLLHLSGNIAEKISSDIDSILDEVYNDQEPSDEVLIDIWNIIKRYPQKDINRTFKNSIKAEQFFSVYDNNGTTIFPVGFEEETEKFMLTK